MNGNTREQLLQAYVTGGFRSVDGWASPSLFKRVILIDEFQERLGIGGGIGEIGVHHGKFFVFLYLLRRAGEKGIAIDLFDEQDSNIDNSGKGDREIFLSNVQRMTGDVSNLEIFSTNSMHIDGAEISRRIDGKLRLFSIDGGHLSNIVAHDLSTARDCIAPGGVILIDDYLNPEFPGVAEGVLSFLTANRELRPFCVSRQKLYLTTAGHEQTYVRLLYEAETGRDHAGAERHRFVPGKVGPVRLTDLLDTEVLCYSDDEYSAANRMQSGIKARQRRLRETLSSTTLWKRVRNSSPGRLVKTIADRFLPY